MAGYSYHICGLYYVAPGHHPFERQYLPQLALSANTKIISSTSRTTLTQTFVNPRSDPIPELRYTFPIYAGVSVVGFTCTINDDRVIRGVVKERAEARETYQKAVDRGETAGLLEQLPDASDVFTTTVGNVPGDAKLRVDITYLGELKHDAESDGIRFTIPTHIAPRYGSYPGQLLRATSVDTGGGISIVVDIEMPDGSNIKNVQSPSHPISVTLGNTSTGAATGADMSLQKASATLALPTAELGGDFVLQVAAANTGNPAAVLEAHPTLTNQRALMATLVPKFSLPSSRPEIVFLCDRSGSMGGGNKIPNLRSALHLFLKSLPVGVKFNICSFGSRFEFLFNVGSRTYDASTLEEATRYVDAFSANFGGTDIYHPMEEIFKRRYEDMDLEVFLLTDGEIWDHSAVFELLNKHMAESSGRVRVFTLGIGRDVSHALIEGVAAAGNGFSQTVGEDENMNRKVVRMLKASLTPHVKDYTLEVKYAKEADVSGTDDDGFEIVEKVMDALTIDVAEPEQTEQAPNKPISLFDESADPDVEMEGAAPLDQSAKGKYSHVPPVSEPRILQAPFTIPPLFPFNRTTVYLLLSPETARQQPKSIVLRGTSPHGPLELEIPVTVLPEKGETIHQLAARKAVKELEEGRGWIYHARDGKDAGAALLKDKYPGRFSDMVEREAVRLGVRYQVGGRWCSFVAVEDDNEPEIGAESSERRSEPVKAARRKELLKCAAEKGGLLDYDREFTAQSSAMAVSALPAAAETGKRRGRVRQPPRPVTSRPRIPLTTFAARRQPEQAHQLAQHQKPTQAHQLAQSRQFMQQLQRAAPAPAREVYDPTISDDCSGPSLAFSPASFAAAPHPSASPVPEGIQTRSRTSGSRGLFGSAMPPSAGAVPAPVPGTTASPFPAAIPDPAGSQPADRLNALVAQQTFAGAWGWDTALFGVLGLDGDRAAEAAAAAKLLPPQLGKDVLATALALAFLEEFLAEVRDEWEMLADKARAWLAGELAARGSGWTVDAYVAEAGRVLKGQGVRK